MIAVVGFGLLWLLANFLLPSNALPSISVNGAGDLVVNGDGGSVKVVDSSGNMRDISTAPRPFGARFAFARFNDTITIASSYGFGGLQVTGANKNLSQPGPDFTLTGAASATGFPCGIVITYGDNGSPLPQLPTCTFQPISTGTYVMGGAKRMTVLVTTIDTKSMGIWVLGTNGNPGPAFGRLECDTGDGLMMNCFV